MAIFGPSDDERRQPLYNLGFKWGFAVGLFIAALMMTAIAAGLAYWG